MKKILIVGQTPPPFGGQALMIEYMLNAKYDNVRLYHVRMAFSKEMDDRGKISFYKVIHIITIILSIIYSKFRYRINTLYYPPSNSPKVSIYKDAIILYSTRWLFKTVIFHFHAAGISEIIPNMKKWERKLIFEALKKPEITITSSTYNPKDGDYLQAKKQYIVPLGIPSISNQKSFLRNKGNNIINILFVGLLNSTKGEVVLLEAVAKLIKKDYKIKLLFAGKFQSVDYKNFFLKKIKSYEIEEHIEYLGIITGENKAQAFRNADIFCFPSFFESESFGIVLLEAMQYGLPLIGTKWRGIQSIIEDNKNGYLVPIKDPEKLAERIEYLINNPDTRKFMGKNSKEIFLEKYTINRYIDNLNEIFKTS